MQSGFVDRWLFAFPEKVKYPKFNDVDIDEKIAKNWHKITKRILDLPFDERPKVVPLSASAKAIFKEWYDKLADRKNCGGSSFAGIATKMDWYCGRLVRDGEEGELLARRELLRNAEKFMDAFAAADYALSGGDDGLGAASQLKNAENALHSVRALGARFSELCERLESLYSDVYDLAETVRDLRSEMDFSPQELDAVESRADQLYRLKKKYGATVGEMLDYLERSKKELDEIEYADDRIVQLQGTLAKQEKEMLAAARTLSDARKAAAKALEERILRELRELDMNKVRFSIDFTEHEPDATGIDTVRFLMSANAGEDLKPIHKIASGGELARIMLALKNVLAEQDHVMTMVFDEVDTGVSGRAAQRVAEKMAKLSRRRQVLCVTHLPQLAAMADTHFSVEKGEENGRTFTRVVELDRVQRCAELARLTGGAAATETQLRGAEELLSAADAFRSAL